jgi:hypothetical protein
MSVRRTVADMSPGRGRLRAVTPDDFWNTIADARTVTGEDDDTQGEAVAEALADILANRSIDDIFAFQAHFDAASAALYRYDIWAAAYLIGGGCSEDGFVDFRAGVIALGKQWFDAVIADPDVLADHPAVVAAARDDYDGAIVAESVLYAASSAHERQTGDTDAFYDDPRAVEQVSDDDATLGPEWDFDDDDEMHARLPRLSALFIVDDLDD